MSSFCARFHLLAVAAALACSGCYTTASVLGRDDGGSDAGPLVDAAPPPPTDAFVVPVDAPTVDGAPDTSCSASVPCDPSHYCDYGGGCGGPGATGTCVEATFCSSGGGLFCGCDGAYYTAPCEALVAGTAVSPDDVCTGAPVSDRAAAATTACSPSGGPAWTFTIAGTDSTCGDDRPGIQFTLFADLTTVAPGTRFDLDATRTTGVAQSCPYGLSGACITLSGTVRIDSFEAGVGATITYGLAGHAGTRDAPIDVRVLEHAVEVTSWCVGSPSC